MINLFPLQTGLFLHIFGLISINRTFSAMLVRVFGKDSAKGGYFSEFYRGYIGWGGSKICENCVEMEYFWIRIAGDIFAESILWSILMLFTYITKNGSIDYIWWQKFPPPRCDTVKSRRLRQKPSRRFLTVFDGFWRLLTAYDGFFTIDYIHFNYVWKTLFLTFGILNKFSLRCHLHSHLYYML